MQIRTNNNPRPILDWYDLTAREQREFDFLSADDRYGASFFRYCGVVYYLNDFQVVKAVFPNGTNDDAWLMRWDAYHADSYFSAVVVKFTRDNEHVIVGMAYS